MTTTLDGYKKKIVKALKANKSYSAALEPQVGSLATALRTLDLANREIDSLECTTVFETTRYGEKMAPHPVFKIAKDAQDSVTRQMKALRLTVEDLAGQVDDDPLIDLTKKLAKQRTKSTTLKPDQA